MKSRNINTVDQLSKLLQKKVIIVDLRDEEEFKNNKIDGAINIPAKEIGDSINYLKSSDKPIIFCSETETNSQKVYDSVADLELEVYNGGSTEKLKMLIDKLKSHESYGQRNIGDYFR